MHPLDLLDEKSDFYIAIPASADPQLVGHIITENVQGISPKNRDQIIERIDTVYAGVVRTKNNTQFQASASCDVPLKILPKLFTPKNGFSRLTYSTEGSSTYDIYKTENIDFAFPSSKNCLLGRNIAFMLDSYDSLFYSNYENSFSAPKEVLNQNYSMDTAIYEWLLGVESNTDEIRFYAPKPQSFLSMLLGRNLDLKLNFVKGSLTIDTEHPEQYKVNLDFDFKQASYMKVGKALLLLAFGLTDSRETVDSPTTLCIQNIKISKEQLLKLLVL